MNYASRKVGFLRVAINNEKIGMSQSMDLWNSMVYPKTGVYAVSSQFDKFAFLVADYLAQVPPILFDHLSSPVTP